MDINSFSIIVTIVVGLLTIIQIISAWFKSSSGTKVQQSNIYGNNTYNDNSIKIKTTTTINNPRNNSDNDIAEVFLIAFIGLIILAIMMAFYQMTYLLIPTICLILLTVNIFRETKMQFDKPKAKVQWTIKNIIFFIVIICMQFIPQSILNIVKELPEFHYESFQSLLDSLLYNIKFVNGYLKEAPLIAFNLIGRMLVTFLLFIYLFKSSIAKKNINKNYNKNNLLTFSAITLLMILGLNLEFFWNLVEPYRNIVANWFNPLQ
ncbi:hypothetical protein ACIQXG_21735 [Lysinibacillus sphaericus]|uniref:hypothetical protein n=1 Tax=Lysinibacillus sphaericus TaxID=1421 RepID=UPI0038067363